MVDLSTLQPALALGPLDGRYRRQTAPLINHLSEAALNRMRLHVEVEWLLHLTDARIFAGIEPLDDTERAGLRRIVEDFDGDDITALAEIEKETVHDVKAVEYHLKKHLAQVLAGRGEEQVGAGGGGHGLHVRPKGRHTPRDGLADGAVAHHQHARLVQRGLPGAPLRARAHLPAALHLRVPQRLQGAQAHAGQRQGVVGGALLVHAPRVADAHGLSLIHI